MQSNIIKADWYYLSNLKEIKAFGSLDKNPRPKYADGTPAHTKFITQVFEKYDISNNEFPITTLRNTAIKTGIKEILAIYQGQTNTQEGFESHDVSWWSPWMNEQGNIGKAYSYNLESHRPNDAKKQVVKIEKKVVDMDLINNNWLKVEDIEIKKSIDGKIYKSNYRGYGDYIIIGEITKDSRPYIECQFLNNGYVTSIRKDSLLKKQHPKNNNHPTLNGVGYLGSYQSVNNFKKSEITKLKNIWSNMIRRCYSKYGSYLGKIFVHPKWHSFENFLRDIRYIPQYNLAKEVNFIDWELDKDYYGSNCYGPDTCVFLSKSENTLYRSSQIKPIEIITDNSKYYELSYTSLAKSLGLSKGYTKKLVEKGFYKNLKFRYIDDVEYLYRYELSRNQLNSVLSGLKNDKYGRRHIISFWNWANIDKKMLVECAYETIWTVRTINDKDYLDMTLIQRSNDYIMAGYINKIQYVALQMMFAGHLGYEVGNFCHFVQNLHIYDRHMNAVEELMTREPIPIQPTLRLKEKKDFYSYTVDDFIISGISDIKKLSSHLEIAI